MNVLGVDLSLTATGVCYPDGSTVTLKPPKAAAAGMRRLAWIRDAVWDTAASTWALDGADLVVIEGYNMGASRATSHAHELGELGGVVRLHLFQNGVSYVDVPPASLKKFACGKGNAPKDTVFAAAIRAGFEGDDNNAADAWWLHQMGRYQRGAAGVSGTGYRDDAIGGVVWPPLPKAVAS